jgi:predicted nucleic acid-binding protein
MPSEEIIVADSSPLIGLARIGRLGLLPQLGRRIIVPRAVWAEVTGARTDAPGTSEVAAQPWIEVMKLPFGSHLDIRQLKPAEIGVRS